MSKEFKEKLRKIIAPLINEDAEFVKINSEVTCYICGFPFERKVRTEAVDEALEKIINLFEELVGKEAKGTCNSVSQKFAQGYNCLREKILERME